MDGCATTQVKVLARKENRLARAAALHSSRAERHAFHFLLPSSCFSRYATGSNDVAHILEEVGLKNKRQVHIRNMKRTLKVPVRTYAYVC